MEEYIVHADSKNRNITKFPNGNSYVLDLVNTISGVVRVDLISARIPNSMYNLTSNSASFTPMSVPLVPGFYSASTLEYEINNRLVPENEMMYYSQHEGKFYYLTNDPIATVSTDSEELSKMLGIQKDVTYTVETLPLPINSFYYAVKSERVVDFSLNEYVFLDIEEFRGPRFCDAAGNLENTFAVIPMDVYSGQIKTFKETSDYVVSRKISNGMMTLSRLTVRWYDKNLNLLNFQGFENNGFVLRVYTERIKKEPTPTLIDEPVTVPKYIPHQEKEIKPKKGPFGKWAVFLGILGVLLFWYTSKKLM
jgi:hypothetical protein